MRIKIPLWDLASVNSSGEYYEMLKAAGVKLHPYRNGGFWQPLYDWFQWEGRPSALLVAPWTLYRDDSDMTLVIEQDAA